jgi:hypothetical protein
MDNFYKRIGEMGNEQRRMILGNIIIQLRNQQQHHVADAFNDILVCYPPIPLFKHEQKFRLYLAWPKIFDMRNHPLVNQIVNQPI